VISDDSWPGHAICFSSKNNDTLAQRIGNPPLVGPADAPLHARRDRPGTAIGHPGAVKFRDAAAPGNASNAPAVLRR
jgi:hypothetical protein